jgi:hypothetical protein
MDKTTYWVMREGRQWRVELAGDSTTEYASTKEGAIERARVLARRAPRGEVVVLDAAGDVEQHFDVEHDLG